MCRAMYYIYYIYLAKGKKYTFIITVPQKQGISFAFTTKSPPDDHPSPSRAAAAAIVATTHHVLILIR